MADADAEEEEPEDSERRLASPSVAHSGERQEQEDEEGRQKEFRREECHRILLRMKDIELCREKELLQVERRTFESEEEFIDPAHRGDLMHFPSECDNAEDDAQCEEGELVQEHCSAALPSEEIIGEEEYERQHQDRNF